MATSFSTTIGADAALAAARSAGVELWVEGTRLRYRAPPGALTAELRQLLAGCREGIVALLRDEAKLDVSTGALAANQQGLWFLHRLAPESCAYNLAFATRVWGELDADVLQETLQILVDRYESLRTTYSMVDGVPRRHVAAYHAIELDLTEASDWDERRLRSEVEQEYARPFELDSAPPIRARLYRLAADQHVFLLVVHHIAVDGTSLFALLDELFAVYTALVRGEPVPPRADAATFSEFVVWQEKLLAESDKDLEYWLSVLTPLPPPLELPFDRPRSGVPELRGSSVSQRLDAKLTSELRELARRQGVTDYVVLLSLWVAFLHRLTGQDDITVGTPVQGRPSSRFNRTVGDLVNTLPLRLRDLAGVSFVELLHRVRTVVLGAMARQDVPLARMVGQLRHRTERGAAPFQTLFVLQDFSLFGLFERLQRANEDDRIPFGALTLSPYFLHQQEGQFDLQQEVWPHGGDLVCLWRFAVDVFDAPTIERLAEYYLTLVRGIVASPDLPLARQALLSAAERRRCVVEWNDTAADFGLDETVVTLFARQAEQRPDAVAVRFEGRELTYAELDARSTRLARNLRSLGVDVEAPVALAVERGPEMLVGLLGILKAGGAYVPLDPAYPEERLRFMLEDCGAAVLITQTGATEKLFEGASIRRVYLDRPEEWSAPVSDAPFAARAEPRARAYILYTSGSTGRPKGVEIEHRALTNFLCSMMREPGLGEDDVLLAVTTLSFDIAGLELWLPLIRGARIELASRETAADPVALARRIEAAGVTIMQATPATWRMLLDSGWGGSARLKVLCGGEQMTAELARRLLPACRELWNLYGPTETTIWSSVARIESPDDVTIGRPIANTRIYVLDDHLSPVPPGLVGELWIGGEGVARGYLNRPDLTAERFVEDPFHGGRMYRTGDRARYLHDGRIVCLGRADGQVKIRGHRIELGEIEAVLATHPGVRECAVVAREVAGDRNLFAYVVGDADSSSCRAHLRARLPSYMIPAAFIALPALPRTPNNKIDRNALPSPANRQPNGDAPESLEDARESVLPPRTQTEQTIAGIWSRLLNVEHVGLRDNFFDLGGHSLLAARFVNELEKEVGVRMNPREVIYNDLEQLAAVCDQQLGNRDRKEADDERSTLPPQRAQPAQRQEAFHFGPRSELVGIFHPPARQARDSHNVVLSYPMGQEYMRCHRAVRQLAVRLSDQGFPCLRFDYYGCGDSFGEHQDARLERWVADIHSAIDEVAARSGSKRHCLIGIRMGATLAALAAAERDDVVRLVLWNPVVDGRAHREELRRLHKDMLRYSYLNWRSRKVPVDPEVTEILGVPFGRALLADVEGVDLVRSLSKRPAHDVLLIESAQDASLEPLRQRLAGLGAEVELKRFDGPALWLEEPFKQVVPVDVWGAVAAWLEERSE